MPCSKQEFADQCQKDALDIAISHETVEGGALSDPHGIVDHLNDNYAPAAAPEIQESQAAVPELDALDHVDSCDDVTHESQNKYSESSNQSGQVKESQPSILQAIPCESVEVDTDLEDHQNSWSSKPTDIQKVSLEDKSLVGSDCMVEMTSESEIHVIMSKASGSHQVDNGGEKLFEDTGTSLVAEPKEKQDAITELDENGQFEAKHEPGIEEPGEESVCGFSVNQNENHFPVVSVNDNVLDRKECDQQIGDSEQPFELHPTFSIVKPETELAGEKLLKEAKTKLLPEPNVNQGAITEVCENGRFEVGHGLGTKESGTGSVGEPSFDENENHFPVLSVTGCVLEWQESYQHVGSSVKPFDIHPSSSVSDTPIPAFGVEKSETDLGGEKLFEDRRTKLLLEPNQNEGAITGTCVNDCFEVDHGLGTEEPGNGSVGGPPFNENENYFPVLSVNGSVLERNESYPHTDDSKKPFELHPSSSISHTPILASSCVKPETDLREMPGQHIENAPFDVFQRCEVDQGASSCKEVVEVQLLENLQPESEDIDALAVESVENGYYITKDKKMEIKSCAPDPTITVIHQAAEIENSVGGDTNSSAPGKTARFENKTDISVKVDDFSCSDGHSSIEHIGGAELVLVIADAERENTTFHGDDVDSKNEIVLANAKSNDIRTVESDAKSDFKQENSSGIGSRNVSSSDVFASEGNFSGCPVDDSLPILDVGIVDVENKEEQYFGGDVNITEQLKCQERHGVEKSNVTSAEISDADANNQQDMGLESLVRLFHFLVKMPRFDDSKIREQVRQAQLLVEEKTQLRDAFRLEILKCRLNCREHASRYETATDEARASKRAVKSKRAEIDSLQSVINKVKNALSVEDIDARIMNIEHMIEHETLPLKEEKQFIREIKQLKQLREQLFSNIGRQDEVQQALNNRDQIEGRLKALKKELDGLKDSVLKAEAVTRTVEKMYEGESIKLKEAQAQFKAANNVRQEAYEHMQSLRREMYEKNQRFHMYKDNAAAAYNHAAKREAEALHNLCFDQVESTMELWNKDADFRKEYVRCNMRSTVRRLGTFDGRSLGPDEKPQVVSNLVLEGVDMLDYRPGNSSSKLPTEILQQEGQEKPVEVALSDEESKVKEVLNSWEAKTRNQRKLHLGNGLGAVSGSGITNNFREEERLPNEEELELVRKDEELRKEDTAAKLKEQRRLEEKSKALEALERKKRNAEKAQTRAELRAQKEAEQREKEREKRLRKKERKKATAAEAPDANNFGDTIAKSEGMIESIKEPEIKEASAAAVAKRTQKPSQFTKQSKTKLVPPPLRNRGRKKLQQWIWVIVTCLVVVILFLVGNIGFFSNLSNNLRRPSYA